MLTMQPFMSAVPRPVILPSFRPLAGQTGTGTSEQLEMISTDPRVMHGQAVIIGTRVPVSVILDCLAAGMTAEEITAEYPTVTVAGVRAAGAYGAALAPRPSRCWSVPVTVSTPSARKASQARPTPGWSLLPPRPGGS